MLCILKKSSYVLSLLLCGVAAFSTTYADIVLDSLKEPVPIRLQAPLTTSETLPQTAVSLTIPDTIRWKESIIPAGTVLQASVLENKPARRLGRPAHFKLAITGVTLPQQPSQSFSEPTELTLGINPYETNRSLIARQSLMGAASHAVAIPLAYVPGISGIAAYGIGSGVDVVVGASQELQKNEAYDTRSPGKKASVGAFRALTGIPTYAAMLKKGANLNYRADELVMASLKEPLWERLLQPAN
jgi:hypothetical protein